MNDRGEWGTPIREVRALSDDALAARIVRRARMRYAGGADPAHDRPAHVRAASGIAWLGERLAVIQDDASFVALVDPATGTAEPLTLPPGAGGARQFDDARGNKAAKRDLEALVRIPTARGALLVAFGSGRWRRASPSSSCRSPMTIHGRRAGSRSSSMPRVTSTTFCAGLPASRGAT